MDAGCFISSSKANVNLSNCTIIERKMTKDEFLHSVAKVVKLQPKMRYTISQFAGDYYYNEIHIDEVLRKAVTFVTDPK